MTLQADPCFKGKSTAGKLKFYSNLYDCMLDENMTQYKSIDWLIDSKNHNWVPDLAIYFFLFIFLFSLDGPPSWHILPEHIIVEDYFVLF